MVRRFGTVQWLANEPELHPLLSGLGPEPFDEAFGADYLYRLSRGRKVPVKQFLMDNKVVVGVGNIYANEALFAAGIHPEAEAGKVDAERLTVLTAEVKAILAHAIKQGGTTLKDFTNADGKPGYFAQKLHVYGRGGETCTECGHLLSEIRLGQRTTVFCSLCQTK